MSGKLTGVKVYKLYDYHLLASLTAALTNLSLWQIAFIYLLMCDGFGCVFTLGKGKVYSVHLTMRVF